CHVLFDHHVAERIASPRSHSEDSWSAPECRPRTIEPMGDDLIHGRAQNHFPRSFRVSPHADGLVIHDTASPHHILA
ncbi:hypothetical protein, partial [Agrobacterium pusense]|uniref:hypothetical protein n=1 Tax=Agrobacterium pusense TaxID=648995 RepID=UPI002FDDD129